MLDCWRLPDYCQFVQNAHGCCHVAADARGCCPAVVNARGCCHVAVGDHGCCSAVVNVHDCCHGVVNARGCCHIVVNSQVAVTVNEHHHAADDTPLIAFAQKHCDHHGLNFLGHEDPGPVHLDQNNLGQDELDHLALEQGVLVDDLDHDIERPGTAERSTSS